MNQETMREKCLEKIEALCESGKDVAYPVQEGVSQVYICGSADGYVLRASYGPKIYSDAEEVLTALIAVEQLHDEANPLKAVFESLNAIA